MVVYEAPHRLARTLADLAGACGPDRPVSIGRELTKLHEETWRGTLAAAVEWVAAHPPRGELVLVLAGAPAAAPADDAAVDDAVRVRLAAGDSARDAAAAVAAALGVSRRRAYAAAVAVNRR